MSNVACVECGGTTFKLSLSPSSSPTHPSHLLTIPTTTPHETLSRVVEVLKGWEYDAVCIATFGPVDLNVESDTYGHITTTPKPGWRNTNLIGWVKKARKCRIVIETDVNVVARAEWEGRDLAYVTVGTGVGVGAVVNVRIKPRLSLSFFLFSLFFLYIYIFFFRDAQPTPSLTTKQKHTTRTYQGLADPRPNAPGGRSRGRVPLKHRLTHRLQLGDPEPPTLWNTNGREHRVERRYIVEARYEIVFVGGTRFPRELTRRSRCLGSRGERDW